jgi:hypothetical protein
MRLILRKSAARLGPHVDSNLRGKTDLLSLRLELQH